MNPGRAVALALAATLSVVSVAPADAEKKKQKRVERTSEARYVLPPLGAGDFGIAVCINGQCVGGAYFITAVNDNFVSVEIHDGAGQPVWARVYQDYDKAVYFCGSTDKPLPIKPGKDVWVDLFQGPCLDPLGPALATTGVIQATFSNLP
ncbi:MAG: hypothetical protein ACRDI3_04505 [Actinomycetota bacterium]